MTENTDKICQIHHDNLEKKSENILENNSENNFRKKSEKNQENIGKYFRKIRKKFRKIKN